LKVEAACFHQGSASTYEPTQCQNPKEQCWSWKP